MTQSAGVIRRGALSLLGAAIAVTCVFSASGPAHTVGASRESTPTIDCQTRLQLLPTRPPPPLRGRDYIAAGPVVFTAWFRDEPRRQLKPDREDLKRIKAPIFVEADAAVTIELTGLSARRAEIEIPRDHGRSARSPSVRLVPCPPDAMVGGRRVGHRTPFIGGFRIAGPMCMELTVLPDGASEPVRQRLPFGRGSCQRRS